MGGSCENEAGGDTRSWTEELAALRMRAGRFFDTVSRVCRNKIPGHRRQRGSEAMSLPRLFLPPTRVDSYSTTDRTGSHDIDI